MANGDCYIVVCREALPGVYMGSKQRRRFYYELATRQTFSTGAEALTYARTVSASRKPIVVTGRFFQLRPGVSRG